MDDVLKKIKPYTHVLKLLDILFQLDPLQTNGLKNSLTKITKNEIEELENYLIFAINKNLTLEYLARSYQLIVLDFIKESLYFKEHKKYRHSKLKEVSNHVYFDKEYMSSYMHGVFISLFFWPNHLILPRNTGHQLYAANSNSSGV